MIGFGNLFVGARREALCRFLILLLLCFASLSNAAFAAQNPAGPTQIPSLSPSPGGTPANAPAPAGTGPNEAPSINPSQGNPNQFPSISPAQELAPITVPPNLKLQDLPAEEGGKEDASAESLKAAPVKLGALIQVAALHPLALDASFNQPISLSEALDYALEKSLPIRISHESQVYQASLLGLYMSYFLPTFSTNYSIAGSSINGQTNTNAKVYSAKITFPLFAGGSYAYFTIAQLFRAKGWHQAYLANLNDALLDVYNKYTNLVLNHQLLRIRIKAVEVCQEQLKLNTVSFQGGSGTKFAIMQARTQLATARQALLAQQVGTRQAALLLAYALDMPLAVNLVPADLTVSRSQLIRGRGNVKQYLDIALRNRPEMHEYQMFRLAASRDVQIAAASLYPNASIFLAYTRSDLTYTGNSSALNGAAVTQLSLAGINSGTVSNTALGQTASLSPNNNLTANTGANTSAASVVAASGGTPIANTQSGSLVTSGAVAPSILSPVSVAGTSGANINGSNTASAGSAVGIFTSWQAGLNLNWSFTNLSLNYVSNVVGARSLARQALLQANQQVMIIEDQVRNSYLNALAANNQIESTGSQLDSTREALRLAELRLKAGTGTNLELIQAQSDYVNSLTTETQSLIAFQQAQAQLIHDIGVISRATLTGGYAPPVEARHRQ
jgi:outer membrane protein TolC